MTQYNPQAEELNKVIKEQTPVIFDLLTERAKEAFFPKKGILGQTAEAKGTKINATIGVALEADGSPMKLQAIAEKVDLKPEDIFLYAPSFGKPNLRQLWQDLIKAKNPSIKSEISLPIVACGATHSLTLAGFMFTEKGDEIIIPDKYWGNYNLVFCSQYGAKMKPFNTFKDGGFDIEAMREKLLEPGEKKILILNFPNNPSGYTPTNKEAERILEVLVEAAAAGKKLVVISDDSYFGLVYKEGVFEESIFAKLADLHKNILAVKVDGATKEYFVWGFRVGFVTLGYPGATREVYDALESKIAGAVRGNVSNCSNLSQSLVFEALKDFDSLNRQKEEKFKILKARFAKSEEALQNKKYEEFFKPLPCNSGYFLCVELVDGLDADKVRKVLLEKYSTGVISLGNLLRLAFSSVQEEVVPQLFENIYLACKDVAGK